jgi:hypothetical protein
VRWWTWRQWSVAALTAGATVLLLGVPTDLVDTPLFGRAVAPTAWAWPVLLVTAVLSGLLAATYVAVAPTDAGGREDGVKAGMAAEVLTFFAVGCPVCNKLALVALGTTGAIRWFAPVQPLLAVAGVGLLVWVLRRRLASATACAVSATPGE